MDPEVRKPDPPWTLEARLYAAALAVLVLGLGSALIIYLTADDDTDIAMQQIFGSKAYVRQLQRFGGKASVLFDDIDRWFAGLWEGRSLAVTVAWISVLAGLALFLIARHVRRRP